MLNTAVLAIISNLAIAPTAAAHMWRPSACNVQSILKRVGTAIGGNPSRHGNGITTIGTMSADGIVNRIRETVDFASGKFIRDESGSVQSSRVVFDGHTLWLRDWTGGVHPLNGIDTTMGAVTDAYLRRYGYLNRGRDAAMFRCVAESTGVESRYDILSIVPRNGREVRLWIDRRTGLLVKTVQRTATSTATTDYQDYRQLDGFVLPFLIRSMEGSDTSTLQIKQAYFNKTQLPRWAFAPPSSINDGEMIGGVRSTTVPLLVENGQALVEAYVDGHRLLFQLDTGGHAILTREAAHLLNLHPIGAGASGGGGEATTAQQYAAPQSLEIGQARIPALPFYVIAYGRDFWDRGRGRAPLAGILGLELFERFAVRLNYRNRHLTLTPLQEFAYHGLGTKLPLTFEEDTPLVPARADDDRGAFQLDTGNSGGTILFGPFVQAHHFDRRYPLGFNTNGSGTGGEVHLQTRRLQRLVVDGLALEHFVTYFADQRTGAFSSRTEAGNLGYDVLSQFETTFDYLHLVAYVQPLAVPELPVYNRTGLAAQRNMGRLVVNRIRPDSPASEAGIVPKDSLVRIDGRDGATVSMKAFRSLTRGAIGSLLELDVEHRGKTRHVVLRLRELLCTNQWRCSPAVRHVLNVLHGR